MKVILLMIIIKDKDNAISVLAYYRPKGF